MYPTLLTQYKSPGTIIHTILSILERVPLREATLDRHIVREGIAQMDQHRRGVSLGVRIMGDTLWPIIAAHHDNYRSTTTYVQEVNSPFYVWLDS